MNSTNISISTVINSGTNSTTVPTLISNVCLLETLNTHCVTSGDLVINTCIALVGLVIVIINVMALATLHNYTDMDDPTNYFLANLSAADALTGVFVLYDVLYNILQFKNYIECVIRVGLFCSVNLASVLNLMTLTLDRYFKITHPYVYIRHVTILKVKVIEGMVWIMSLVAGSLPFFGWSSMDITKVCNVFGIMTSSFQVFLICLFCVPLAVMTYAYARLIIVSRGHSREITALQVGGRSMVNTWKSVKTAFTIVGAYFVCWVPLGIFTLLVLLTESHTWLPASPNVVFTYLLGLGILNSVLNPVIYATKIPVFRHRLKAVFCVTRVRNIQRSSMRSVLGLFRSSRRVTSGSVGTEIIELGDSRPK